MVIIKQKLLFFTYNLKFLNIFQNIDNKYLTIVGRFEEMINISNVINVQVGYRL